MSEDRTGELAQSLQRRGLAAPARLLLEAHRPLRPLLAEATAFLSPALRPLVGKRYTILAGIFERDETYDALIDALDDAEHR